MSKFNFDRVAKNMQELNRTVPVLLANAAQKEFTANFQRQGFDDVKWQEVNRRIKGTREYKYPKKKGLSRRTKPILIGTGNLRRKTSSMIRQVTSKKVRLILDLPYAARHNYGLDNMPQRQVVGQTKELTRIQKDIVNKEVDRIWQV